MRIAFDGTALRPGRTGVGYYTEHLLHHLARTASNDELIVVSNRSIDTTSPLPPRVRIATPPRRVPRLVWMQTLAVTALRQVDADVVHFTNGMLPLVAPVPTVVTIHDMSLRLYPRYHPPRRVLLNRPLVDLAARRADAIITPSESRAATSCGSTISIRSRVHVVHEAAAPSFRPVTDAVELERVRRQLPPRRALHSLRRHDRAAQEPAEADRRLRRPPKGGGAHSSARLRRPVRVAVARHRGADRTHEPRATRSTSRATCRSTICRRSTASQRCSSTRRCTRDSACRSSRPWRAARRSSRAPQARSPRSADRRSRKSTGSTRIRSAAQSCRSRAAANGGRSCRPRASSAPPASRGTAPPARAWRSTGRRPATARRARRAASVPRRRPRRFRDKPSPSPAAAASPVDVLFGQAYFLRFDPKLWEAQQPYAPLGTLYAAAACASAAIASRCSTRCSRRPKPNGPRRSIAIGRASPSSTRTTSTTCRRCACCACGRRRSR